MSDCLVPLRSLTASLPLKNGGTGRRLPFLILGPFVTFQWRAVKLREGILIGNLKREASLPIISHPMRESSRAFCPSCNIFKHLGSRIWEDSEKLSSSRFYLCTSYLVVLLNLPFVYKCIIYSHGNITYSTSTHIYDYICIDILNPGLSLTSASQLIYTRIK